MVSGDEAGVSEEKKQERVFFDPPLWSQRLQYVAAALEQQEVIESSKNIWRSCGASDALLQSTISLHQSPLLRLKQLESRQKKNRSIKRVVDFGCGEGKLLQYLIHEDGYEQLIGIDIDYASLREALSTVEPKLGDYVNRSFRSTELTVSLLRGSIDRIDTTQIQPFDVAVVIEV